MKKDLLGFEFHSHYNFPTKNLNRIRENHCDKIITNHKIEISRSLFAPCSCLCSAWLLSADQLVVMPWTLRRTVRDDSLVISSGPGPSPARVSASSLQYYYPGALVSINPSSSHHDVTYWHEKQPPSHGKWYALIFVVTAVPVAESSPPPVTRWPVLRGSMLGNDPSEPRV